MIKSYKDLIVWQKSNFCHVERRETSFFKISQSSRLNTLALHRSDMIISTCHSDHKFDEWEES